MSLHLLLLQTHLQFQQELLTLRVHPRIFGGIRVARLLNVLCCHIVCLSSVLWCPFRFPHRDDVRFVFTSGCLWEGSASCPYLPYLCLFAYSVCPIHIVSCFCFVCLRLACPMLPISLDCQYLIAPFGILWRLCMLKQQLLKYEILHYQVRSS